MNPRKFHLNFMGDVMLGRLIDQLLPAHVHAPEDESTIKRFLKNRPDLQPYTPQSPWGTTLPLLKKGDLNIINLETSVTTYNIKWPNKVFNYRMHPDNLAALKEANIDYAGLANNHTLDFSEEGLVETVKSIQNAGVAFTGSGLTREEALRPATLQLPNKSRSFSSSSDDRVHQIHIWAASDHPTEWAKVSTFHFIDIPDDTKSDEKRFEDTKSHLRSLIRGNGPSSSSLKIFSLHWGPNYSWQPSERIQALAHFLIDECGIDIVHGHSSHHVQGVERYQNKLIIYGCGDFVDDYAEVPDFRNNLGALWRVTVSEDDDKLKVDQLEVFPTKITNFKAQLLESSDEAHQWVTDKITKLSKNFDTEARFGNDGQLVLGIH